jgi:hypothetical protein
LQVYVKERQNSSADVAMKNLGAGILLACTLVLSR